MALKALRCQDEDEQVKMNSGKRKLRGTTCYHAGMRVHCGEITRDQCMPQDIWASKASQICIKIFY